MDRQERKPLLQEYLESNNNLLIPSNNLTGNQLSNNINEKSKPTGSYSCQTSNKPVDIKCPVCRREGQTVVKFYIGWGSLSLMMCLIWNCGWELFWLPFCFKSCKNECHYCQYCGELIYQKPFNFQWTPYFKQQPPNLPPPQWLR